MPSTRNTTHRHQSRKQLPARRAAGYERPAGGSPRPEQIFDSRVELAAVCPETALMYAVLEDAFLCFHKQFEAGWRFMRRAREAEDWFFSNDVREPFSFLSICSTLRLEPRYIRKKLSHWTQISLDTAPATR